MWVFFCVLRLVCQLRRHHYDLTLHPYTGLSKINGVKFRELSLNFPKLADWLSMGRPSCLAALGREFSSRGTFLLHNPVHEGRCCIFIYVNQKFPRSFEARYHICSLPLHPDAPSPSLLFLPLHFSLLPFLGVGFRYLTAT